MDSKRPLGGSDPRHWIAVPVLIVLILALTEAAAASRGGGIIARLAGLPGQRAAQQPSSTPVPKPTLLAQMEEARRQTQAAAPQTPYPWTLWTPTPDTRPTSTPDYSAFVYRRTDAGVIYWEPDLMFLIECFKAAEEIPYKIVNAWDQLDGPIYPYLTIYAGSYAPEEASPHGAVFVYLIRETDFCSPEVYLAPTADPDLEIVDADGHRLLVQSQETGSQLWFNIDTRSFEEALPTATPSPTPTPPGGPLPPSSLSDYVLFAQERITLGAMAAIRSGNIGVNDASPAGTFPELKLGTRTILAADTLSADTILVEQGATVSGILFFNELTTRQGAVVPGTRVDHVDLPILPWPESPPAEPGSASASFVVESGEVERLFPGRGGAIIVRPGGRLLLSGGLYEIRRFEVQDRASVECLGECEVRVTDEVVLGPAAHLGAAEPLDPLAFRIFIVRQGGIGLKTGPRCSIEAYILAPQSALTLGADGEYGGSFVGKTISIGARAAVH